MTIYEYFTAEYNRTAQDAWDEVEAFENVLFWCYENDRASYDEMARAVGIDPTAPI